MTEKELRKLVGKRVTAKRAGWDEVLTPEQFMDMEPYADKGYASDDLEGVLVVTPFITPGGRKAISCLVGGQEADPKTIRPIRGGSGEC